MSIHPLPFKRKILLDSPDSRWHQIDRPLQHVHRMSHLPLPNLGIAPVRVEIKHRLSLTGIPVEELFTARGFWGDIDGVVRGVIQVPGAAEGEAVFQTGTSFR
jgi:hypothetical protein